MKLVGLGCPRERIVKLPMGVNTSDFHYAARRRLPGEPVRLLSVARLVPVKGHAIALQAIALLRRQGMDLRYTVVGGGALLNNLRTLANDFSISDVVIFTGPLPHNQVRNRFYESHICVLPSIRSSRGDEETQGVVIQEAQATGMPVVITDIGGVAEGIITGQSGVVARAGDADSLAAAIRSVAEREAEWPVMGRAGRALVEERFDCKVLSEDLIGLYKALVQLKGNTRDARFNAAQYDKRKSLPSNPADYRR